MFRDEETRSQVRDLLLNGTRPKEILSIVGTGCTKNDIGNMKFNMTKAGELKKKKNKSTPSAPVIVKKKKSKKNVIDGDFTRAAESEMDRLQQQAGHFQKLIAAYTGEKNDFVDVVEKKLKAVTAKIDLLESIRRAG
jgi:hypothetical protein